MGKCDEIRELYNSCYGAQKAYENIITALELAVKNGECGKYFIISASKVIAAIGGNYKVFMNILPTLKKRFEEEGFVFKYTPAGFRDDDSYITLSGWADKN